MVQWADSLHIRSFLPHHPGPERHLHLSPSCRMVLGVGPWNWSLLASFSVHSQPGSPDDVQSEHTTFRLNNSSASFVKRRFLVIQEGPCNLAPLGSAACLRPHLPCSLHYSLSPVASLWHVASFDWSTLLCTFYMACFTSFQPKGYFFRETSPITPPNPT